MRALLKGQNLRWSSQMTHICTFWDDMKKWLFILLLKPIFRSTEQISFMCQKTTCFWPNLPIINDHSFPATHFISIENYYLDPLKSFNI